MRSHYKISELNSPHFITCTTVAWLPIFTRQRYLEIITTSLTFCRKQKGLLLYAYVILDNHLHLIVHSDALNKIIRDFKRHTAREIIKTAQYEEKNWLLTQLEFHKQVYKDESTYQVWQEGFHPQAMTSEEILRQKLEYIHYNPVKLGLVDKSEDWRYSSARNYLGFDGLLEIDQIEL